MYNPLCKTGIFIAILVPFTNPNNPGILELL